MLATALLALLRVAPASRFCFYSESWIRYRGCSVRSRTGEVRMRNVEWFLVLAIPLALFTVAAPAAARPRDDALSGAIRCGVVADSRQWLDCYYGAAQPVRIGLGLAPATAVQVQLAASPPPGGPPRDEAVRNEVVAAAAACMREPADRPWLDCYYAAAVPMRAQLGLPTPQMAARPGPAPVPPPQPQIASLPPPPPARPSGPPPMPRPVGILGGLFNDPRPIVRDVPLESYAFDKKGAFTITLPDGQVWEQIAEDEIYHRARWRRPASTMRVTIKPDAMHTFVLTLADQNYMYKVHRIR
jgi:hypothetical protein